MSETQGQGVRAVGDVGCERVHKEKKIQSKGFASLSQERARARCGDVHQPGGVRALGFHQVMGCL